MVFNSVFVRLMDFAPCAMVTLSISLARTKWYNITYLLTSLCSLIVPGTTSEAAASNIRSVTE